ncbi:MAG: YgiQ family radical SAM protein [OM182 bacterium MED-G28]|uniref:YgiQ family radical SAM protein n=1 Tax=OM182 bacterium MED-G28 TaxID=1986256 RepID=A0A2A5WG36_9GAMM|nr:MAG: YgiQ family radical SAM protein [OM182 bacterium MED-G28]
MILRKTAGLAPKGHSDNPPKLYSYPKYWAECFGTAQFLPMSKAEMDELGWDSCDIILVTADAYVDHPSFGMAVVGRLLEAQGFRVGIISQPRWDSADPFKALGKPNLFFGVTGGNMDSLINRYTADLRIRSDDAYTPHGKAGKRPDRSVIVYSQRCREAYYDTPIVIGGIEASLRRIAQYDYWSDKVRRSILIDSNANILLFGNAERALAELAHQMAKGVAIEELWDLRGSAIVKKNEAENWTEIDSTRIDWPAKIDKIPNPYDFHNKKNIEESPKSEEAILQDEDITAVKIIPLPLQRKADFDPNLSYIRLPSYNKVVNDPALYAHASRVLHQEANPYNGKVLVQKHGQQDIWVNPPPIPLETDEMDWVFDLPFQRKPHPDYGNARIPAYDMIKTSVNIMRGCFGGCTFCSITEHEGRIIQSRSEDSIIKEIEKIRDHVPGFSGTISDLGGPTANMYKLNCNSPAIQKTCKRLSCVYPNICKHLNTDHSPTTKLYRKARAVPGVKRVAVASGLRYDLALKDPEYIEELVTHHVGGYLKIAPEHSEQKTLSKMMKPSISSYDEFKVLFDRFSKKAGKEQYLIPYFIAAHPGCDAEEMLNLSLWLKDHDFKPDQVQTFYPSPMALATAMYYSEKNPLEKVRYKSEMLSVCKDIDQRRLQKAFLRYHDEKNWPILRKALTNLGRHDLIGNGKHHLIPPDMTPVKRSGNNKQRANRRHKH